MASSCSGSSDVKAAFPYRDVRLNENPPSFSQSGDQEGQQEEQQQQSPCDRFRPRERNLVGPGPGAPDRWVAFDPGRIGEDEELQGDLGPRAQWKARLPEGTSHGKKKRTLQLLIDAKNPHAKFYVWVLQVHVYQALTSNWHLIQGAGRGGAKAKGYLKTIFDMLELD